MKCIFWLSTKHHEFLSTCLLINAFLLGALLLDALAPISDGAFQDPFGQSRSQSASATNPKISINQRVLKSAVFPTDATANRLPKGAIMQLGTTSLTHGSFLTSVRFSPNDELVASADSNGVVRIWETQTGRMILEKANGGGRKLAFSPDGKTIAIGGYYNEQIILWDLRTNEYFGSIVQNARCLEYSKDGKVLYAVGQDAIVRAWNLETKKLVREFKGHKAGLYALALSPDGKMLATGGGRGGYSANNEIRLWNTESGELIGILDDDLDYYEKLPDAIYSLAFSRDGKTLGSAGPYVVRLWDVEQKKIIDRLSDGTYDIEFAPHQDRFVVPGKLGVYDLKSRQREFKMDGDVGVYGVVEYSHDGKWIATGNKDGRVQIWNSETGKKLNLRHGHDGGVRGVSVSAGGSLVASVSREDGSVRVWGLQSGKELQKYPVKWRGSDVWWNEEGNGVFFAPYGQQIHTWLHDGTIRVWSLDRDSEQSFRLGKTSITMLAFSPDGIRAAAMEYNSSSKVRVSVYELDGSKLIALIDPFEGKKSSSDNWISSMAFSSNGKTLAIGTQGDTIRDTPTDSVQLWDLDKVEMVDQFRRAVAPPGKLLFSPNGKWLASSSSGGAELEIRELPSTRVVQTFKVPIDAHGRDPAPMAFSKDGKLFAAANVNREIFVWETLTWKKSKTFRGHQKAVTDLEFTPDGNSLISSSEDNTLLVWEINKEAKTTIRLSRKQLEEYWTTLADADGDLAGLAMKVLYQSPQQTVQMLDQKLEVGFVLAQKELPGLIAQLKHDDPQKHLQASLKIREYGRTASPYLFRELSQKQSAPTRSRIEELLETINRFPVSANELRRKRSIQILERIGSESAKAVLQRLAESEVRSTACLDAEAALLRLRKLARMNQ